jgi:hypothetical protein
MHELLVVMQVETVEVGALATLDLFDAQDLPFEELDRLAGAGLKAYSRMARRTSATRSGATPRAMVRSISSSCCWLSCNLITFSAI